MSGIKDKVVVVTGGGRGIGYETCKAFAFEGAKVVVVDMDQSAVDAAVESIGGGFGIAADVSDPCDTEKIAEAIAKRFGRVDVLINNAGITRDASISKMSYEMFDQVMKVNLYGTFNCVKAVLPQMIKQQSGCIVNAASVVGIYGNYGQTNYVASKAGVIGMTKTWARELSKFGIRCNAIAPGFIETHMTAEIPEKTVAAIEAKIPMHRRGTPAEVADAYVYLCSDQARYINGIVLEVGGGLTP